MTNLSLARIMYGTNQSFYATNSIHGSNTASLRVPFADDGSAGKSATLASTTLGGLLRRAWAALHHKA
jgi:hypothetical protein